MDFKPGEQVLDAFSGSGAFGINAALQGAKKVISVDTSELAISCGRNNAERNSVSNKTDSRCGTVEDCIATDERFDLIIANPPLLPGNPASGLEGAVFDSGIQATIDFIKMLPDMLNRNGRCYLVTSDILERCQFDIQELGRKNALSIKPVAQMDTDYEQYTVHRITVTPWLRVLRNVFRD